MPLRLLSNNHITLLLCRGCHSVLFRPSPRLQSASILFGQDDRWPLQEAYERLRALRLQIDDLLREYRDKLSLYESSASESLIPSIEAARLTTLLVISHYEEQAQKLQEIPPDASWTEGQDRAIFLDQIGRLQKTVCGHAVSFARLQRLRLKVQPLRQEAPKKPASMPELRSLEQLLDRMQTLQLEKTGIETRLNEVNTNRIEKAKLRGRLQALLDEEHELQFEALKGVQK